MYLSHLQTLYWDQETRLSSPSTFPLINPSVYTSLHLLSCIDIIHSSEFYYINHIQSINTKIKTVLQSALVKLHWHNCTNCCINQNSRLQIHTIFPATFTSKERELLWRTKYHIQKGGDWYRLNCDNLSQLSFSKK